LKEVGGEGGGGCEGGEVAVELRVEGEEAEFVHLYH